MRPVTRDPAPSRLAYRLQRWALTPMLWRVLRLGLPLALLAVAAGLLLGTPEQRQALKSRADALRLDLQNRDAFLVRLMEIDGASPPVAAEIRRMLPLDAPLSSFEIDLTEMRDHVAALDAVASARLRVRPGGILHVSVTERVPAAILRNGAALTLVDAAGVRVGRVAARDERADLPVMTGVDAGRHVAEALELVGSAGSLRARVRGLVRVGARRWDVILDRGQRIRLPADGAVGALAQVVALHEAQDLLARDVATVDMRRPSRPTVRLPKDTAAALRAIKLYELGDG